MFLEKFVSQSFVHKDFFLEAVPGFQKTEHSAVSSFLSKCLGLLNGPKKKVIFLFCRGY